MNVNHYPTNSIESPMGKKDDLSSNDSHGNLEEEWNSFASSGNFNEELNDIDKHGSNKS